MKWYKYEPTTGNVPPRANDEYIVMLKNAVQPTSLWYFEGYVGKKKICGWEDETGENAYTVVAWAEFPPAPREEDITEWITLV